MRTEIAYPLASARYLRSLDASGWTGRPGHAFWLEWNHPLEGSRNFADIVAGLEVVNWPRLIRPGVTCIDIGSHSADTTIPMGLFSFDRHTGRTGRVYAVEPNPELHALIEACLSLNGHIAAFSLVKAAITAADMDEVELGDHSNANCNGGIIAGHTAALTERLTDLATTRYMARGVSLETLVGQILVDDPQARIDFIKTDCEGYDKEILKGAADTLRRLQPILYIEWFDWFTADETEDLFQIIEMIGYVALHPGSLRPLDRTTERTHDLTCVPRARLSEFGL